MPHSKTSPKSPWLTVFLLLLVLAAFGLSLFFSGVSLNFSQAFTDPQSSDFQILWTLRLPRILLAALVGLALASSGVAFQSLLKNPLADPYILGVSGGAALGSVLALSFDLSFTWVSLSAFLASLLTLSFLYRFSLVQGKLKVERLLLAGVLFNALSFSAIMFLNSLASFEKAHRIWYLMVGSLAAESYGALALVAGLVLVGWILLYRSSASMNLIVTGQESAQSLGLDVEAFRKKTFLAASLMVGAVVSLTGLIGFVGLFVPHLMRLVVGSDHRRLLPAAALFGATLLIVADWGSKNLLNFFGLNTELPIGVLTALIGGPLFFYLLKRAMGERF